MKAKDYVVYKHTCPNGKVYIGITNQKPLNYRFRNGKGYIGNEYFTRAINKYGWDNITHEVVFDGLTKEEACDKEIELIAEYNSTDQRYGYNILQGGNLSTTGLHWKLSEEAIKRHKEAAFWKGKNIPEDIRKKMSDARKGKPAQNRKRILCVELECEFSSVTEAAKQFGVSISTISNCLSGYAPKACGYTWRCL